MDGCSIKQYSDACVQTSPNASATRLGNSINIQMTPAPNRLKRVAYVDVSASGAYLDDEVSRRVYPRTPIHRVKTQLPVKFSDQVPHTSPSIAAEKQRRVVSLPEQLGNEVLSQKLARSLVTSRNVSMPATMEEVRRTELASKGSPPIVLSPSFSYDEECSRLQHYTQASDLLHTPSVPSTPNSVEIVDGSFHLPEAFLRNQGHPVKNIKAMQKDWLTWSTSPPRPIPALHGPSSLPYARCPSGAEGTIIEEPSSVPRLIWGLKNNTSNAHEDPIVVENRISGDHSRITAIQDHLHAAPGEVRAHDTQELSLPVTSCALEQSKNEHLERSEAPKLELSSQHKFLAPEQRGPTGIRESQTSTLLASQTLDTGVPMNLNEQVTIHSRIDHSLCEQPVEIPHATIHEYGQRGDNIWLDEPAPISTTCHIHKISEQPSASRVIDNLTSINAQGNSINVSRDGPRGLLRRKTISQNTSPTLPDSRSPLCLSGISPLLKGSHVTFQQQPHANALQPPVSQLHDLNLHASAESLRSLSDQLRGLILRQQQCISSCCCGRDLTPFPTEQHTLLTGSSRPRSSTLSNASFTKPEMPINLHDLVVRHMGRQVQAEASSDLLPEIVSKARNTEHMLQQWTSHSIPEVDFHQLVPTSDDGLEYRSGRGDVLFGKRHPCSMPLTRLLENKLAPVPEETSFVSTSRDVPSPAKRPSPTPITTSVKATKDYNFTELRSPLEETMAEEARRSQGEVIDHSDERRVLEPARQRQRQAKRKDSDASNGTKVVPRKSNERKANDENVHNPTPSTTASKKKSKATNKNTIFSRASVKRTHGPQKTRQKN